MDKVALLSDKERIDLFEATALKKRMRANAVEKDFWICFMINHLFNDSIYKKIFVFKGGTSLSKSFNVIERFSEDIDLVLDWNIVDGESMKLWEDRSKTKQDNINKEINHKAAQFFKTKLVPTLNDELKKKLGEKEWVSIDGNDEMVINFYYPQLFEVDYLLPVIRLEIGPLAEWMPSHIREIKPFAAECYPNLFVKKTSQALTIDLERTFWEKITILHKISNFPDEKVIPYRYARHLYDVYCMANSQAKNCAFDKKDLLERDVSFKNKFYYSRSAHYETATLKKIRLIPTEEKINDLKKDYDQMANMIYGDIPTFDEIIGRLKLLEDEIHDLF